MPGEFGLIADIFLLPYIFSHYFKVENQIRFHDKKKKKSRQFYEYFQVTSEETKDLSGQMRLNITAG